MPNGCMACSGAVLNWIVRELAGGAVRDAGETPHAALDRLAAAVPAGAEGLVLLPYFLGEKTPLHDPLCARHAGRPRPAPHASATSGGRRSRRVAFGFRHHVEVFEELGAERAPRGRLGRRRRRAGSGCRSRPTCCGRPVQLLAGPSRARASAPPMSRASAVGCLRRLGRYRAVCAPGRRRRARSCERRALRPPVRALSRALRAPRSPSTQRLASRADRSPGEALGIQEPAQHVARDAGDLVVVAVVRERAAPGDRADREDRAARGGLEKGEIGANFRCC